MKNKRKVMRIIWWIYIVLLFLVVVIKFRGSFSELRERMNYYSMENSINYNLVPFKSIGSQIKHISESWALINLLGNIVPFVPFGFLLPIAYKRINSFVKVFSVGLLSVILIEVFQFITKLGSFDVDDIMLNSIGIIIGYFLIWLVNRFIIKE